MKEFTMCTHNHLLLSPEYICQSTTESLVCYQVLTADGLRVLFFFFSTEPAYLTRAAFLAYTKLPRSPHTLFSQCDTNVSSLGLLT